MRASIDTNTRISILASRKNRFSERNTMGILLVLELIPNFACQALAKKRCCSGREDWEASDIFGLLEVGSALGFFGISGSRLAFSGSRLATSTKLFLSGNHGLDTIVHILNKFNFRETESSFVRNIIDVISRFRMLTMDTSDLHFETVSYGLEFVHLSAKFRECDMD